MVQASKSKNAPVMMTQGAFNALLLVANSTGPTTVTSSVRRDSISICIRGVNDVIRPSVSRDLTESIALLFPIRSALAVSLRLGVILLGWMGVSLIAWTDSIAMDCFLVQSALGISDARQELIRQVAHENLMPDVLDVES